MYKYAYMKIFENICLLYNNVNKVSAAIMSESGEKVVASWPDADLGIKVSSETVTTACLGRPTQTHQYNNKYITE